MNEAKLTPKILIVIVIAVLLSLGIYYWNKVNKEPAKPVAQPSPPPSFVSMADREEGYLLPKTTLGFPAISKRITISKSKLPISFQKFIEEIGVSDTEIQKLNFVNGQTGFSINGILSDVSLFDAELKFKNFSQKNQWEMIKSVIAEHFAFDEYKDKDYEIRISYRLKQNEVEVNLQSIK